MCHIELLILELLVVAPLDKLKVQSQASLVKTSIFHNAFEILKKDGKKCNHFIHMWPLISSFKVLTLYIFKYVKLAKLAMCQVLGSIEHACCLKGKLHNRLTTHLNVCVRMVS
jgi:hypothetical protein